MGAVYQPTHNPQYEDRTTVVATVADRDSSHTAISTVTKGTLEGDTMNEGYDSSDNPNDRDDSTEIDDRLTLKQLTVLTGSGIDRNDLLQLSGTAAWHIIHDIVEGFTGPKINSAYEIDRDRIQRLQAFGIPESISSRLSRKGAIAILNSLTERQRERATRKTLVTTEWEG